jgi:hypothetical protein
MNKHLETLLDYTLALTIVACLTMGLLEWFDVLVY